MNPIREETLIDILLHLPTLTSRIRKLVSTHPRAAATDKGRAEIVDTIEAEARDLIPDGEPEEISIPLIRVVSASIVRAIVKRYSTAAERAVRKDKAIQSLKLNNRGLSDAKLLRRTRRLRRELSDAKAMAAVWGSEP